MKTVIIENTLSDQSTTHDLILIPSETQEPITFHCIDEAAAELLQRAIEDNVVGVS